MTGNYKKVWKELEKNVGRCFFFKEGVVKEISGYATYTLTLATFAVPDRVKTYIDNNKLKIVSSTDNRFTFVKDGVRVEITCIKPEEKIQQSYNKMFRHMLRCESSGMDIEGRYINNPAALSDIKNKELHLSGGDVLLNESLVSKIVKYVLNFGYTIGDDIISAVNSQQIFDTDSYKVKFCEALSAVLQKGKTEWTSVSETLRLIECILPKGTRILEHTKKITASMKDVNFIRNYLYSIFVVMEITAKQLQGIMPEEPTLQYFDSICLNIDVQLKNYDVYKEIKEKYGDEFLTLLMDIQETLSNNEECEYVRVSDETFDIGEILLKDESFWWSEASEETPDDTTDEQPELDPSQGNASLWLKDDYTEEIYEDAPNDKVYLDDEPLDKVNDGGIDIKAMDEYESGQVTEVTPIVTKENTRNKSSDNGIMNSVRGHKSNVINTGGTV